MHCLESKSVFVDLNDKKSALYRLLRKVYTSKNIQKIIDQYQEFYRFSEFGEVKFEGGKLPVKVSRLPADYIDDILDDSFRSENAGIDFEAEPAQ